MQKSIRAQAFQKFIVSACSICPTSTSLTSHPCHTLVPVHLIDVMLSWIENISLQRAVVFQFYLCFAEILTLKSPKIFHRFICRYTSRKQATLCIYGVYIGRSNFISCTRKPAWSSSSKRCSIHVMGSTVWYCQRTLSHNSSPYVRYSSLRNSTAAPSLPTMLLRLKRLLCSREKEQFCLLEQQQTSERLLQY